MDDDKEAEKAAKEAFKPLVKWWKGKLGGKASGVKVRQWLKVGGGD